MRLSVIVPVSTDTRGAIAAINGTIGWADAIEAGPGVRTLGYDVEPADAPAMLAAVRDLDLPGVIAGLGVRS